MRCYQIEATSKEGTLLATRVAGTNALARTQRDELMDTYGLKKSQVTIEQIEVPVSKEALLEHLNELHAKCDVDMGAA